MGTHGLHQCDIFVPYYYILSRWRSTVADKQDDLSSDREVKEEITPEVSVLKITGGSFEDDGEKSEVEARVTLVEESGSEAGTVDEQVEANLNPDLSFTEKSFEATASFVHPSWRSWITPEAEASSSLTLTGQEDKA